MIETIKEKITAFSYQLESSPAGYMRTFFKENSDFEEITAAFAELLKSGDGDTVSNTLSCFIFIMTETNTIKGEEAAHFVEHVEEDYTLFELIKEKLFEKNCFNRQAAIKALTYLAYEDCYDFLIEAYDYYSSCDPLSMPRIIQGLIQMSGEVPWDKIETMVNHKNYLFRWAFVSLFDLTVMDYNRSYQYLNKLTEDENSQVADEAVFKIKTLKAEELYEEAMRSNTATSHGVKLEKECPAVHFMGMNNMFFSYLTEIKQYDYELDELDLFVKFYIDDTESVARKFERFKEREQK